VYVQDINEALKRLFNDQTLFIMFFVDDILSNYASSNLKQVMKDELTECLNLQTSENYFIVVVHIIESQKQLDFLKSFLKTDTHFLSIFKYYFDIHSTYVYVSKNCIKFAFHVKDFYLKSANLLHFKTFKL